MKGKVYYAQSQDDLKETRPVFAWVPDSLVQGGKLDTKAYQAQRWPTINCGANSNAIGSHILPDLAQIAPPSKETEAFKKALSQFFQKSMGNPSLDRLPGIAGKRKSSPSGSDSMDMGIS